MQYNILHLFTFFLLSNHLLNARIVFYMSQHKTSYVTSYHAILCHDYRGIPNTHTHTHTHRDTHTRTHTHTHTQYWLDNNNKSKDKYVQGIFVALILHTYICTQLTRTWKFKAIQYKQIVQLRPLVIQIGYCYGQKH